MIAPDMATMLAFIFTDAALPARLLQKLLTTSVAASFNCITVDGDTSTSDTVLLFATGDGRRRARGSKSPSDPRLKGFRQGARRACASIWRMQVVKDGEGAEKLIEIAITGAEIDKAARRIGHVDRQFAAGQDGDRRRGRQLGPHRHGDRQVRREGRCATSSRSGSAASQVAKNGMRDPAYKEAEIMPHMKGRSDRHRGRCRRRHGQGHGVDLRSHAPLYRHQRLLSQLDGDHACSCSLRPWRWSMPMAAC